MSHNSVGRMRLQCSLDELRRALTKIMPEWEGHIAVDPSGNLNLSGYFESQDERGFVLIVPGRMRARRNRPTSVVDQQKKQQLIAQGVPEDQAEQRATVYASNTITGDFGVKAGEDGEWELYVDNYSARSLNQRAGLSGSGADLTPMSNRLKTAVGQERTRRKLAGSVLQKIGIDVTKMGSNTMPDNAKDEDIGKINIRKAAKNREEMKRALQQLRQEA